MFKEKSEKNLPIGDIKGNEIMKKIRRRKHLIIIGVLLILAVFGGDYFLSQDIPPINDNDLQVAAVNIKTEENAYYVLEPIIDGKVKVETIDGNRFLAHFNGKEWEEKFVKELLVINQNILESFGKAIQKPYYQNPATADPSLALHGPILNPISILNLGMLKSIESRNHLRSKNEAQALYEALAIIALGEKMESSNASLVEYLISQSIKKIGLNTIRNFITSTDLSSSGLAQIIKELNMFKSKDENFERTEKIEYMFYTQQMDAAVNDGSVKQTYYNKINQTKKLLAEETRAHIVDIGRPCSSIPDVESLSADYKWKLFLTENGLGKLAVKSRSLMLNFPALYRNNMCVNNLLLEVDRVLAALKSYQSDAGRLPESLNELVPKYLDAVPLDPYDQQPLRYSKEKKILYSVGDDGLDAGGGEPIIGLSRDSLFANRKEPTFALDF